MPEKRKYADRAEYLKKAVTQRRKMIRVKAIKYKGGKCSRCGYDKCNDALDFHHVDGRKDFGISQEGLTRSWEKVKAEVDKLFLFAPIVTERNMQNYAAFQRNLKVKNEVNCWKPTTVQRSYGNQQPILCLAMEGIVLPKPSEGRFRDYLARE